MASTEEKFRSAVEIIKSLPKTGSIQPSNSTKLKFYSYFKQVTEGPCEAPKPGFWEVVNRAKWDAWNQLGNMSKEEAMQRYVDEFVEILQQHSLDDLDDPNAIYEYSSLMGPYIEYAPKKVRENYLQMNGKAKKPLNNNCEDSYPIPVNGHNCNNESDNDEFSDTLEMVHEDEPSELPFAPDTNPSVSTKGPNIVSIRGGGDHRIGHNESNSSADGPSRNQGNSISRQARTSDYTLPSTSNHSLVGGSGGSRRRKEDLPKELTADVGEQLALAVIRLQHIMEQVVVRLDSLEVLLTERKAKSTTVLPVSKSKWSFFGISPKLVLLILAWPFLAQWIMYLIRKRQQRLCR